MMFVILVSLKTMETNRITPEKGSNPFWNGSITFNESCVASVIAALRVTPTFGVNGPLFQVLLSIINSSNYQSASSPGGRRLLRVPHTLHLENDELRRGFWVKIKMP